MTPTSAELELLSDLSSILDQTNHRCFLVGANVRILTFDALTGSNGIRSTTDWDFAVRVDSWGDWNALRQRLLDAKPPCFTAGDKKYRVIHRTGLPLDLVPYGGIEETPGEIVWSDGQTMTVLGLPEAEGRRKALTLADNVTIDVVGIPDFCVLKLLAYLDRRPAVTKDIIDFAHILLHYDSLHDNAIRIHEDIGDVLINHSIDYGCAGAALLGHDIALACSVEAINVALGAIDDCGNIYSQCIRDISQRAQIGDDDLDTKERRRISEQLSAFQTTVSHRLRG